MDLHARIPLTTGAATFIARLTEDAPRDRDALLIRGNPTLLRVGTSPSRDIQLPETLSYLRAGDIVRVNEGAGHIRVVYRRDSPHNVLFFTERCNSRCLMCSQPPREADDGYLVDEILESIPLMSQETPELCITGGEPTLLGERLLEVIGATKRHLPDTSLHMLSNGRLFRYMRLARKIAEVGHPNFMIGIPLYSDIASKHDFVVQAKGAFDETVRGIMNLARVGQRIEIRFVIHQQTFSRLAHTARFIARNLPFVDQVALMGLEMTGFTKANLEALWIDPIEYQSELRKAVEELRRARVPVMIYNHQLCLLSKDLWPIARKSISDWKNIYMPECSPCRIKDQCGGFLPRRIFATASISPQLKRRRWLNTYFSASAITRSRKSVFDIDTIACHPPCSTTNSDPLIRRTFTSLPWPTKTDGIVAFWLVERNSKSCRSLTRAGINFLRRVSSAADRTRVALMIVTDGSGAKVGAGRGRTESGLDTGSVGDADGALCRVTVGV